MEIYLVSFAFEPTVTEAVRCRQDPHLYILYLKQNLALFHLFIDSSIERKPHLVYQHTSTLHTVAANWWEALIKGSTKRNIARIANAVQVTICLLVSTSVY